MVQGASHVTTSGAGLQMVAARSLASFEVRTGSPDGNITATVVSKYMTYDLFDMKKSCC